MRRWSVRIFERHLFNRLYQRRRSALEAPRRAEEMRQAVQGLDTLWRVATYVESLIDEEAPSSLFDVPNPPEWVFEQRRGNAADYAHLAQTVLALGGKEALFCSVYDRGSRQKQVVCALQDSGSWHHISLQGMFSMYDSLTEIADDLFPDWSLLVARDARLRIVTWQDAPRRAGRPD